MPGEDSLSSRFDYLFEPLEPLDEAESADATLVAASSASDSADDGKSSHSAVPVRMAFAAFVLATLAGTAVVAVLLLQRPPGAVEPVDSTRQPAPLSMTVANVPSPPRPVSPVESTPTIEVGPALLPQSEPQTAPTRSPGGGASDTPATRSPISVARETRQPFPNQAPQHGGANEGDLLPGVGLPGPL